MTPLAPPSRPACRAVAPRRLTVALAAVVIVLVPLAAAAKKPKCFPREGHCVAVTVNEQAAVPLTKATRKALEALEAVSHYVRDVRYELESPIRGALDVEAAKVPGSASWFGEGGSVQVQIVPLDPVELDTEQHVVRSPSVRIEGNAALAVANVLQDDTLPPGRYLLRVRIRGEGNWDRQTLFMTVAGE